MKSLRIIIYIIVFQGITILASQPQKPFPMINYIVYMRDNYGRIEVYPEDMMSKSQEWAMKVKMHWLRTTAYEKLKEKYWDFQKGVPKPGVPNTHEYLLTKNGDLLPIERKYSASKKNYKKVRNER